MPSNDLDADQIRRTILAHGYRAGRVEVLESVDSTNSYLAARAADRETWGHGSVVVAHHQVGGRGRLGRAWVTPAGAALTMSVLVDAPENVLRRAPLLAGLAVYDTIAAVRGLRPAIKWPNDILLSVGSGEPARWRKVAGLLAQRVPAPGAGRAVIGVGLNTTIRAAQLPTPDATSLLLAAEPGTAVPSRCELAGQIAGRLLAILRAAAAGADREQADRILGAMVTIGMRIRVERGSGDVLTGTAVGLASDGELVLKCDNGEIVAVTEGDVVHVRPAEHPKKSSLSARAT
ncbi:biotin--[acetyl-CoA-carboxylase] ligase [Rarobacter incanus]|uniref:biotin--[biotin carboxyl-carrier protein] ligase n=1 Tax=Rarobacter incanus TaxID=153494 RepID=A0A542SN79_9MICO|nr:biotin--[acetyl-CoA-carboxylase] ligase [Rarobacter incanus]TQK76081.1 BirA family biotin operon repressor/biotin-[acetyl-CoA-carboxylase] ligase [Rarobacter incanus]